jgi:mannitol-1-/sugar-/sorbitol-6-/2-deoxyglucose-6-phosphatase
MPAVRSVIFDMDGLLIDSEPLWYEAAVEVFTPLGIELTPELYASSIGLRTKEFIDNWFSRYGIDHSLAHEAVSGINNVVIDKIRHRGEAMPGVMLVLDQIKASGLSIGLATSSPGELIDVVVDKLGIREYFSVFSSAENLLHGKPHPQVYLDCASALGTEPIACLCFEDSFHGMIAAKAARMKCVVVPLPAFRNEPRFQAADLLLHSLEEFDLKLFSQQNQ